MKKISVIVPVYNVADYLDKCIKSIVEQTYWNLEIILIDDGSTDDSGKLCDNWLSRDGRIKVVHKENGGLSDARNAGLEISTGDYIGFVDSDDTIESDMYEILVNLLEKFQADVSCCRYANVYENGKRELIGEDHRVHVYEGLEGLKEYLYAKTVDPFVCNKLYRTDCINVLPGGLNPIRFIKNIQGEDNPFNTEILKQTKRVVVVGEAKYNYLQKRNGAITNSGVTQKKIDSVLWWDTFRQECQENYPELVPYVLRRQMLFYIGLYNRVANDEKYKAIKERVRCSIGEHQSEVLDSNICEKEIKLAVILIVRCQPLYHLIMKAYKKVHGEARI